MISKVDFVNYMKQIEALDAKMDRIDTAFKAIDSNFYISDAIEIPYQLLKIAMEDKTDWLDYFMFECDFLNEEHQIWANDVLIEINSWEDVYDFIKEANECNENTCVG